MKTSRSTVSTAILLPLAFACWHASADFVTPDGTNLPWVRSSTPDSAFAQWERFTSPMGPNAPDAGVFPTDGFPNGAPDWDAFDMSGQSFVTGTGNLYSFSAPLNMHVMVPNFQRGAAQATTVILQVRSQGTEIDPASVTIDGIAPVEATELYRLPMGGFDLVDMLYRWELSGNAISYEVRFDGAEPSLALDRISIDTFTTIAGGCEADFNGDNQADFFDYLDFAQAFDAEDPTADFNNDTQVDFFDYLDFVQAFSAGC